MTLFRLVNPTEGSVRIDGIDTSILNLTELRRRIAIIPQEPVMFKGTIRSNLDPFTVHTDLQLWDALRECHMADTVEGLAGKLDAAVAASGSNFSLGQQQLFCLSRAILNNSKLLVLDEVCACM